MVAAAVSVLIGHFSKRLEWESLEKEVSEKIASCTPAIIILLLIGAIGGTWMVAGIVPTMIYYGMQIIQPEIFLVSSSVLCALVSLMIGSSWTTVATIGLALMGIGKAHGFDDGWIAGSIITGAYFGDKLSPLSDSTNLAAGTAQTGLFDHVRAMMTTTLPSLCIAIILYAIISIKASGDYDPEVANELSNAIVEHYEFMHPVLLIPFIAIFVVAILKVPALPGILLLSGLGGVFAVIFQHANFSDLITMWHYGYEAETGNELCDSLLNKGGMDSMLWTNNLVIIAVGFGGILQTIRAVEAILGGLIHKVRTVFQLVLVTIITGMFCITTMCDQYLGLIIPAAMYKDKYDEMGLGRNMLSRTMEDGGTLWSPLVPWSSCGAYHSNILGVSTLAYLPFCFMNLINPVFALVTSAMKVNIFWADGSRTGFTGKLRKGDPAGAPDDAHAKAMEALARIREENGEDTRE